MRIKTICFLVFMLGWILAAVLIAQTERYCCPLNSDEQTITVTQTQDESILSTKDKAYTVPRKQMLIEYGSYIG